MIHLGYHAHLYITEHNYHEQKLWPLYILLIYSTQLNVPKWLISVTVKQTELIVLYIMYLQELNLKQ